MNRLYIHALILFVLLLVAQPVVAQEAISFQGRLTTPDGSTIADGTYSVRFQLFDTPTGGTPQWEETHSISTEGGVFSVLLGNETALDLDAFHNTRHLLLIVEEEAMEPRVPLTAVPYAMKSYRLDEEALVAGQNVSITRRSDGALQIGATGGGGTGGLTSVATDGTLDGNGTSASPLGLADGSVTGEKLANNALVAGVNVDIARRGNGSLEISATGGGGGGLTQVASDATLSGNGTAGSPLSVADGSVTGVKLANNAVTTAKVSDGAVTGVKLADGAVTGVKLADGALVAGSNVTITRQAGGALEVASTGGSGLTQVASDETLSGDGTAGSPLMVSAPLILTSSTSDPAIRGENTNGNIGRLGSSSAGIFGFSTSGPGVIGGYSIGNNGSLGSSNGTGVYGISPTSYGVYGVNGINWGGLGSDNFAGTFNGNVIVLGNLAKSGGSFKIDHPLDPGGKYLSHSFVESPDMMNVYNGNVITDANGEAIVVLPDYFEALNRDFRYQLTVIGQFAQVIVAEEIQGNQFVIRTDQPSVKVSWQVTGIRQDAWAEAHRIVVEEDKPAKERGFYLNPSVFGQPKERGIMWAQHPEAMHVSQETPAQIEAEERRMEAEQAQIEAEIARLRTRNQEN